MSDSQTVAALSAALCALALLMALPGVAEIGSPFEDAWDAPALVATR